MTDQLSLDDLVTSVATDLMGVTSATMVRDSTRLLHRLVDYFDVDNSFLRRNDRERRVTILVAEWPPRENIPDPDPIGVVYFEHADPIFAATEHLQDVLVLRPTTSGDEYQDRIREASGISGGVSVAGVPLLNGDTTIGVLGFSKNGDREWSSPEINALRAMAALLAQLQGRIDAENSLVYLASHDELTGLANRRALIGHLERRLQLGAGGSVALIFMDVDRLKALNSFLGHRAGDEFLQTLASRLHPLQAAGHMVARLGGDEFVVVLDGSADQGKALEMAKLLRQIANTPTELGGEEVSRAVSVGVTVGYPGRITVSELLGQADQAMYISKSRGGNEITAFSPELHRQDEMRTDIELHLRPAIRNGSMILYYQPEIDLRDGSIVSLEALVRWPHPTLGLLLPGMFIDVVEATNLAGELTRYVIDASCRQLVEWHTRFPKHKVQMSVNISPAQLITLDFVETVEQILESHHLDGHYVTLEITEKALLRDTARALITLRDLKKIGVRVAIDDFGTGYSSLAQLKALPVDTLKIDRTFVRDLGTDSSDMSIVKSIINLARAFDLAIVAEGVESGLTSQILLALGCTNVQGFLISEPRPAAEIDRLLSQDWRWRPNNSLPKVGSGSN